MINYGSDLSLRCTAWLHARSEREKTHGMGILAFLVRGSQMLLTANRDEKKNKGDPLNIGVRLCSLLVVVFFVVLFFFKGVEVVLACVCLKKK